MLKRKPETLALFVALIGTLAVLLIFFVDLLLVRHHDLEKGEERLQHFSTMMAEHTARTFSAVDVLLREMAGDLAKNRSDWESLSAKQGWEYVAQRHTRAMPHLRNLSIIDREGNQRFISTHFPSPGHNIKDRPYFIALENGAEASTFGPLIGRSSGRYGYALARRISGPGGKFNGIAFAAIEPSYLPDFCWPNRLADDFEAALINSKGEIVASCRPSEFDQQSPLIGKAAAEVLFDGQLREHVPESGLGHSKQIRLSVSPVPGFPDLHILAAIPERVLVGNWHSRLVELSTLALLICLILLVCGLLVRRQVRDMAALTAELAASHENLEARVSAATAELAGEKNAAEQANRAKSRFLAAASHDLRQPMHALALFAADLERQIHLGATQALPRLAEQISTSSAMLGELLDSLLDISRLDVAGIQPQIRPFALGPLFERLSASGRRAASDRKQTLCFRPTTLWVESDPVMIERIISNLVANALRYTPAGGRILIAARRRGKEVSIEVRDNGMGIAPEHQAAIFAEFYQVDNKAREHGKGLGLGLSIVERLARALKVGISLRSQLGAGTTFALNVRATAPLHRQETEAAGKVWFVGSSAELLECMALAERWNYVVLHGDSSESPPMHTTTICDAKLADIISRKLPHKGSLIVLTGSGTERIPLGAHPLPLPLRPAKLRALLGQIQNTLSKSMP